MDSINNDLDHLLYQRSLHRHFTCEDDADIPRVSSCILMALKDVLWNFIYKQKYTASEEIEETPVTQVKADDKISLYRLGSYALFRIKKRAWKTIKCPLYSKKMKASMKSILEVVEVLEEADKSKFPKFIQNNRNLLVMKSCLLPFLCQFSEEFHLVVNSASYAKYGKDVYQVAEKLLKYNKDIERGMRNILNERVQKCSHAVLKRFGKDFISKLFNVRCKAFLKSIELLEEEKHGKAMDRDVMLRQKLKVDNSKAKTSEA